MDTCVLWNLTSIYRPERPAMQELVRLILANGANPNDLVQDIGMTDRSDQDRRDRDPGTFLITALLPPTNPPILAIVDRRGCWRRAQKMCLGSSESKCGEYCDKIMSRRQLQ